MKERNNQKLNAFIFRTLVLLNALFLFPLNVEQVSAEELTNDFETHAQIETVSEEDEHSDEELVEEEPVVFEEEVTSNSSDDQESVDEELGEELSDETVTEAEAESADEPEAKNLSDDDAEADANEQAGNEVKDEDQSAIDEVADDSEETLDGEELSLSEDAAAEETEDADVSEEDEEVSEEETNEELEADTEEDTEDTEADADVDTEEEPEAKTASANRKQSRNKVEVDRISGQNRYKNAVEISKSGWNSANTVIITNGQKFADSLTGSPLASLHNAPILLTRANSLPTETLAEIKRLNAKEVIVLGGEASVSNGVLTTLRNNGFSTRRIGGRNRYLLAENIANEVMKKEGKNRDAFLVSGEVHTDAMSIAPVAASKRLPIFLTRANVLHQAVINAIPYVNSWTIIGGQATINQNVQNRMENLGARTRRIDGKNRYEVNRNVINFYGASGDQMYVASGNHFSDATPASVLAARKNSSVLLVNDNSKNNLKEQRDFANSKGTKKLTLIGGQNTLSKETETYFENQNHLIYLDPGHGGWETGAVGWVDGRQYLEKDLNLQVSFKVRDLLEDKGYDVFMARTNDKYISLHRRPEQANNIGADIFVSIHHNAMPNSTTTTGIETFYYGSSSKYPPLDKNRPYHNDPSRLAGSKKLANLIHGELIDHTKAYDRGVKRAAFVVVREARMPAVLLEYGFMSTPTDLRVFTQNWYQNRLAQATVDGIVRYFAS